MPLRTMNKIAVITIFCLFPILALATDELEDKTFAQCCYCVDSTKDSDEASSFCLDWFKKQTASNFLCSIQKSFTQSEALAYFNSSFQDLLPCNQFRAVLHSSCKEATAQVCQKEIIPLGGGVLATQDECTFPISLQDGLQAWKTRYLKMSKTILPLHSYVTQKNKIESCPKSWKFELTPKKMLQCHEALSEAKTLRLIMDASDEMPLGEKQGFCSANQYGNRITCLDQNFQEKQEMCSRMDIQTPHMMMPFIVYFYKKEQDIF